MRFTKDGKRIISKSVWLRMPDYAKLRKNGVEHVLSSDPKKKGRSKYIPVQIESVNEALKVVGSENVGTKKYDGKAWYWPHDYRHYLRDASFKQRKAVHNAWVKIGVPVKKTKDGEKWLEPKSNQKKKAWTIVRKAIAPKELGTPIPESVNEAKESPIDVTKRIVKNKQAEKIDGVLVDSEILAGQAFSRYLANININLSEQEFSKSYAGNKLVEVVSKLSSRFNIKNQEMFFEDVMKLSHTIYTNDLTAVSGVKYFLDIIDQKKLIGSNSGKKRIIEGLKKVNLNKYFDEKNIFSFDMVKNPKPQPDIYIAAINTTGIKSNDTIILEDSIIGVRAGVEANIKVIGVTSGKHWLGRSSQSLQDAGAYAVANNFEEVLKLIEDL